MPKIIQLNNSESNDWLKVTEQVLRGGGVIGFPTDTYYGLGADPFNPTAIEKIFTIKAREKNKPILLLIGDIEQLSQVTKKVSKEARILMKSFWPGPLTLLFEARNDLPNNLLGDGNTIGVRLPDSIVVSQLLRRIKKPITATSANASGQMGCKSGDEVSKALGEKLDLVLDGGHSPGGKASTIIDTSCYPPKLIRDGVIEKKEIETALNILLD